MNSEKASFLRNIPVFAVGTYLDHKEDNDYFYSAPSNSIEESVYLIDHIFIKVILKKKEIVGIIFLIMFGETLLLV